MIRVSAISPCPISLLVGVEHKLGKQRLTAFAGSKHCTITWNDTNSNNVLATVRDLSLNGTLVRILVNSVLLGRVMFLT